MKKIAFLLSILYSALPASAQYSTASVSGPWIGTPGGSTPSYLIFDGLGHISEIGMPFDSLYPVGTDSVSPSGAVYSQLNLLIGTGYGRGQMVNDSSFNLYDTIAAMHLGQDISLYKVLNPGALSGVWSGTVYDSSSNYTRNIQMTVNSSGAVTAATGIPLTAGRIFAGRDTFAGYITTTDDSCAYRALALSGVFHGDSLYGPTQLGIYHNGSFNCQAGGYATFVRTSSGIADIPAIEFSVYPNPFTEQIEISVNNPAGDIQADIYDLYGRKILSRSLGSGQTSSIDASMLSSGMYMLTLTGADGKTSAKKIMKN
jgi:hypothetical protein